MCDLCSKEKRVRDEAKRRAGYKANAFRRLAKFYDRLSSGEEEPHSYTSDSLRADALSALHAVVEDGWV